MNWGNKDWVSEDQEFLPKRRVDNKISWQMPHIIGSFYSNKMNRVVEYHSLNECLFFFLLELDSSTVRYYVQPINIGIQFFDDQGNKKPWSHVPDVLVFKNGSVPLLYQSKERDRSNSTTFEKCNFYCKKYSNARDWYYSVIYPKVLPKAVQTNIKFLEGFIQKRRNADKWIPEIIARLSQLRTESIINLASDFSHRIDPLHILPIIYHLIATGVFSFNLNEIISEYTEISCFPIKTQFSMLFHDEEVMK